MDKSVKVTLIIAVTVLILGILGLVMFNSALERTNPSNTVTTEGTSTIKVVPDTVSVSFNVLTRAKTADEASTNNSAIVEKLITNLVVAGFDRDDIKTEYFSINPEYDWSRGDGKITGYVATHQLKLTIDAEDSEIIGKAIDSGVESGALISYINFELGKDKEDEFKAKALEQATANARLKADSIAKGLGKEVSRVVSVSTSDFNYNPWVAYKSAYAEDSASASPGAVMESAALARQAATSITPSEKEVSATVRVTFKLK
jgi:uncharacterized protein